MININIKQQRMLFSILIGGCLLLLSCIVIQKKIEKELTIQQKKAIYMTGKLKKQPWDVVISKEFPPVMRSTLIYEIPELLYLSKPSWFSKVKKIKLEVISGHIDNSTSNSDPLNCNIEIKLPIKEYLTKDEKVELNFNLLNKIAHCFSGKQILLKENLNLKNISIEEKSKILLMMEKQELLFIETNCDSCEEKNKVSSPIIVYSELLSDAIATYWLLKIDGESNIFDIFYKNKTINFIKNPITSIHPSHFILKDIQNEFKNNNTMTYDNIENITQNSLNEYLQEMSFHYDKIK